MPKELDEIEDLEAGSSAAPALDVAVDEAGKPAVDAPASSSPATDETETDSLSVVRDVVDQREPAPAAAAPSAESEEAGEAAGGQASKELDNENFSDVAFHKHPRFQHLIRERNSYREDAVRYNNVQTFIDQHGLSAPEAADGLEIMGLMKTNPQKAWELLRPRVQNLLIAAGEVLPDDLAKRVDGGEMSRDAALEVSRARASVASQAARQQFDQQRTETRQQTEHVQSLVSTAAAWETDRRLKDPNFDAKMPRIQEKIAFLHATEGKPKDVAGVKDQLKRAYDAVNKEIPAATPTRYAPQQRKPAIRPVNGGQVAGNARPEVNSTVDLIRNVVSQSRRSA